MSNLPCSKSVRFLNCGCAVLVLYLFFRFESGVEVGDDKSLDLFLKHSQWPPIASLWQA